MVFTIFAVVETRWGLGLPLDMRPAIDGVTFRKVSRAGQKTSSYADLESRYPTQASHGTCWFWEVTRQLFVSATSVYFPGQTEAAIGDSSQSSELVPLFCIGYSPSSIC